MTDKFDTARTLYLDGVRLFEAGRYAEAAAAFEAALALVPGRASVLVNLAVARLKLAQPDQALAALDSALAADAQQPDAWTHRGAALAELGRDAEALASFEQALALEPGQAVARYQRAQALDRLGRHAEALRALDELLKEVPGHAHGWMLHGQTLQLLRRHGEAGASYQEALALDPGLGMAWSHLGHWLHDQGRLAEAAEAFSRAAATGTDVAMNRYFFAAVTGRDAPPATPEPYLRALFDSYTPEFEAHLLQTQRYRAHELVVQAAQAADPPAGGALDLGCGTGLCGPLLRPGFWPLAGVDLSSTMLAMARERGVYDELVEADIALHLQRTPQRYALLVAADVFIYIGDLAPVLAGARRVLLPGGVLALSVEAAGDDEGYWLQPSFRYAHSERYLRELATAQGFEIVSLQPASLREAQRQSIAGLIACLRAPRHEPVR
jgi:predicted TPR repeat methyltransferase